METSDFSSFFSGFQQGLFVGLLLQYLNPYRDGSRVKTIVMNALGVIRLAAIYATVYYFVDPILDRWR